MDKLKEAGASVRLIDMDEPLWFGHYYSGKNACRSSIDNLAQRTAALVKIYMTAFPQAVVGDTEPFPAVSNRPNWAADYAAWLAAFRQVMGSRVAFLHLDFDWGARRPPTSGDDLPRARCAYGGLRLVGSVPTGNKLRVPL